MKYFFTKSGIKKIEELLSVKTLYAFDYDGTLAPIVNKPDMAEMNAKCESLLKKFNEAEQIAIISGRSVEDLKKKIAFRPKYLVGNHGIEYKKFKNKYSFVKKEVTKWKKDILNLIKNDTGLRGIKVEDKIYSLTLHYRGYKNKKNSLLKEVNKLTPAPRIVLGKSIINLIPKNAPNKGDVLLQLIQNGGFKKSLYIGDDITDEDVFSLLDDRILKIRVGKKKNSKAHFYLRQQSQVNQLLHYLTTNIGDI